MNTKNLNSPKELTQLKSGELDHTVGFLFAPRSNINSESLNFK